MTEYTLSVFTPTGTFFEGKITSLVLETPDGLMGVLAGHMPCVASIKAGILKVKSADGQERKAATSQGFAMIRSQHVKVLLQSVEWADDIDIQRSLDAIERAKKRLEHRDEMMEREFILSTAALERAKARLRLTGTHYDRNQHHI